MSSDSWSTEVLVVGGSLGGVAAALAACEGGARVVLTERHPWLGGQLTSQAVPPDEHPWIETHGSTAAYRRLRRAIRDAYARSYPLTAESLGRSEFNPGNGWVSALCAEPRVAAGVIEELLAPWVASGRLTVLRESWPVAADVDGDLVRGVEFESRRGARMRVEAAYVLEATEIGELLPLAGVEHRTGSESAALTGEPSAQAHADPGNVQAVTHVFALELADGDHTIDRPEDYEHWRTATLPGWPGPLLRWEYPDPRGGRVVHGRFEPEQSDGASDMETALIRPELWSYRRVLDRANYEPGFFTSDVSLVNWPMNDYAEGGLYDSGDDERHARQARALSASFLYWLQTEAPRADGGTGHPGLRLRPDVTGTDDGFAQAPYIRESRRIEAITTVVEQDLSVAVRGDHGAVTYADAVGTGCYRIDLHPTTGGDGYLDVAAHPFQIPLGALLPVRVRNVIGAGKSIGSTHITNGCYRVHPSEWSIGEAAGALAAHCVTAGVEPHQVQAAPDRLATFQQLLDRRGVDRHWRGGERLPV
ncbi:FAD-dependent oxidoreductase [Agromyces silvae]|uniref:FAD-dependent oxidoreductase n=1 Tax=Agromyces silvae TaxID=3388266 RepID=UPI00280AEE25|nr:FAD-dependent oxidoreductase [Agromyces protaetiae]